MSFNNPNQYTPERIEEMAKYLIYNKIEYLLVSAEEAPHLATMNESAALNVVFQFQNTIRQIKFSLEGFDSDQVNTILEYLKQDCILDIMSVTDIRTMKELRNKHKESLE